jgi:hypothetical protein
MPHKVYHGKTGVVYNVTKSAVGVIIYKKVKHRYIEKRVNLRIEHVSLSRSREEFVRRVKANAELKKKSKADGTHVHLKRQPAMPREARTISCKDNIPETVVPVYVNLFWYWFILQYLTIFQGLRDVYLVTSRRRLGYTWVLLGVRGRSGIICIAWGEMTEPYHKGIRARLLETRINAT